MKYVWEVSKWRYPSQRSQRLTCHSNSKNNLYHQFASNQLSRQWQYWRSPWSHQIPSHWDNHYYFPLQQHPCHTVQDSNFPWKKQIVATKPFLSGKLVANKDAKSCSARRTLCMKLLSLQAISYMKSILLASSTNPQWTRVHLGKESVWYCWSMLLEYSRFHIGPIESNSEWTQST